MNDKSDVVIDWQLNETDYHLLKDGVNGAFQSEDDGA